MRRLPSAFGCETSCADCFSLFSAAVKTYTLIYVVVASTVLSLHFPTLNDYLCQQPVVFFFNAVLVCPFSPIVSGVNAQVSSFTSAFRPQLTVPESVVAKSTNNPDLQQMVCHILLVLRFLA